MRVADTSRARKKSTTTLRAQATKRAASSQPGDQANAKILSLDALASAAESQRNAGKKVVLCHGVFDLFHVGHLRHLRAAKKFGDVLVVTITGDGFVNKGPDRPAFSSELRAEVLAGLDLVDYVAVIEDPSATPAITSVKPSVYVKGEEYADPLKDISGKIVFERDLVESFGGELVFTSDITYSSSNLLNRFFDQRDPAARDYLAGLRDSDFEQEFLQHLSTIAKMRIVVVGETIIDRYVYVDALGKSAKENILATLHRDEEAFAGGAVAVANDIAALCPNVELITLVGDPAMGDNYEQLVRDRLHDAVTPTFVQRPQTPTVEKIRFVEPVYVRKLFEVYKMDDRPLSDPVRGQFHETLSDKIRHADLVIVCDFGHGMLSGETIKLMEIEAPFLAVNVQSNAGNIGYNLIDKYQRADFICIDAMEARLAARDKHASLPDIVGERFSKLVRCDNVVVTHGRSGCYANSNGTVKHIPSLGGAAVDTVGAGDAFFALAAAFAAAGASSEFTGFIGNVAGAIKIGIVGHRRYLTRFDIQRYVTTLLK